MHVLNVRDVNEALPRALAYLRDCGTPEPTRNGPALVAPGPVATVYRDPRRRVLFDPLRDANPFFHLFESLWILAGRRDVRFLSWFNSRIANYSDDGDTFHAAYGYRLRKQWGFDQIEAACKILRENPQSRQAVLQIWNPLLDLGVDSKDLPCNDMVMLRVRESVLSFHPSKRELDITVCNRSNDAIWGAYGANAVQFSMLQEYMAWHLNVGVGKYVQMSHNLHVYTENPYWQQWKETPGGRGTHVRKAEYDRIAQGGKTFMAVTSPLVDPVLGQGFPAARCFDMDLATFFKAVDKATDLPGLAADMRYPEFMTSFFGQVVRPMLLAFVYRNVNYEYVHALGKSQLDWCYAGARWLERRSGLGATKVEGAA